MQSDQTTYVAAEVEFARRIWGKVDIKKIEAETRQHQKDIIWVGSMLAGSQANLARALKIKPEALSRYKTSRDMPQGKVDFIISVSISMIDSHFHRSKKKDCISSVMAVSKSRCSKSEAKKIIKILDKHGFLSNTLGVSLSK